VFRRIAISVFLLGTCGFGSASARPQYGGALRVETQRDLWQGPDSIARRLTMDGLTAIDASGNVAPALATQWSSQSGGHRWEFRLRPNVRFHDGTALTAEIAAASLTAACQAGCPWTTVRAVGTSVVFTSDSPQPDLPEQLARAEFLISRPTAGGAADGTGPFIAPTRTTDSNDGTAIFAANDDSWSGRPFLDAVEVRARRTIRDQWLDLSVGTADLVEVPSGLLRTAQQQHLKTMTSSPVDLLALQVSTSGALANEKLRQAIALGVDRNALFNVIFQKQGEATASLLPSYLTGYSFLFPTERNLDRAAALRGRANPQITLASEDSGAELQLTAERIAINLREAGFRVQVVSSAAAAHADVVLRRLCLESPDARAALTEFLENSGSSVAVENSEPEAVYRAERDFLAQSTLVPLLYLPRSYAVGERVRDLRLGADGNPVVPDISLSDMPAQANGAAQ
jgi:peptide/nickel transport system substrate-binding protein